MGRFLLNGDSFAGLVQVVERFISSKSRPGRLAVMTKGVATVVQILEQWLTKSGFC
jgi:hypothetical protein